MSGSGYYLDFSEFNRNLKKLVEKDFPDWAEKGLYNSMNELLRDSIEKPPQAPFKKGDLWGSRSGIKPENPIIIKKTKNYISSQGGFNIKYAHRHHEVPPGTYKYTRTGAKLPGPKFMQSKMAQYGEKYIGIVADMIRRKGK